MTVEAVSHHFSDGLYIKQMVLKKGYMATSHVHNYSHLSILAQGDVYVRANDEVTYHQAPTCIEIKAGVVHQIQALSDVIWYCAHATEETDINKVDEVLIQEQKYALVNSD
jgi:quercetin dioxygenase-like cupin family protein